MPDSATYVLSPIGHVRSALKRTADAPKQGHEGAPEAWIEIEPRFAEALAGIAAGHDILLITWLDRAQRDVLRVHPRDDVRRPLAGVFATRSADRPNPLGLHPVRVLEVAGSRLKVAPLEAIDGTPVVDIKPVLSPSAD
jgi:tRNA-Thr(GGU) m(6)t(6)A37 methyltransferase TsaA